MLIITGSLAYDYIMDYSGLFSDHILPHKIHTINLSFAVKNFNKRRGGTAGNTSYTLALLKTPHVLFSVAGQDFDEYKKAFIKHRIDLTHVKIYKTEYTSMGIAMTDKSDNQIWAYSYGAGVHVDKLNLKNAAKKGDLVLIGPQDKAGALSLIKQCIAMGIAFMFDPAFMITQLTDEELELGITHAKFIIGNDYENTIIAERIKKFQTVKQKKILITTLGDKGALIEKGNTRYEIKAAKPKKVIDPTGAGDTWRSGFLSGLVRGFDLQVSGQMGAVAASYAVENYGTQEHKFTIQEFTNRYKKTYNKELEL